MKMGKNDMKELVPRGLPIEHPYVQPTPFSGHLKGQKVKDVEKLRQILTPTIHTLPNLEPVVQPCDLDNSTNNVQLSIGYLKERTTSGIDCMALSAIVFNDTLTYEAALSCEPTVSSLNENEFDFRISFDESDDEDCTIVYTAYPNLMDTAYQLSGRYPVFIFSKVYTAYSLNEYGVYVTSINTAYPGEWIRRIDFLYSFRYFSVRMTKVIKGEFEKINDIKVEDDSLACDSPLEVFNCEVSRLSKMDDDLLTYEDEIANIPCDLRVDDDSEHEADDTEFDPSDIAFTEWLGLKFFNYKTMDYYTMKALWIYWIRGDDEMNDGYCNGGNLPGTFIIENQLHYQDYEWYEALEDSELKDEALRNRVIMEGFIKDDDDESSYEQIRRWDIYTNYDDTYKTNHDDNEREELCEVHESPVCTIQKFEMIKYSFGQGEEYVAITEDEYDDLARPSNNARRTYQKIFRMMDEGWKVTRTKE
ncbi:hypothetical protein Tco_0337358 [Tanacetum coccineum]